MTTAEVFENATLPRSYAVHNDPLTPAEGKPLPKALTQKPLNAKSPAEWAYERLTLYIKNFEDQLDATHEVAMGFTGGDAGILRIEGMGYFDPDIVTFYGTDPNGAKTQMIQHVSQLNVMLRAHPKDDNAKAPRRIGFRLVEDLEKKVAAK